MMTGRNSLCAVTPTHVSDLQGFGVVSVDGDAGQSVEGAAIISRQASSMKTLREAEFARNFSRLFPRLFTVLGERLKKISTSGESEVKALGKILARCQVELDPASGSGQQRRKRPVSAKAHTFEFFSFHKKENDAAVRAYCIACHQKKSYSLKSVDPMKKHLCDDHMDLMDELPSCALRLYYLTHLSKVEDADREKVRALRRKQDRIQEARNKKTEEWDHETAEWEEKQRSTKQLKQQARQNLNPVIEPLGTAHPLSPVPGTSRSQFASVPTFHITVPLSSASAPGSTRAPAMSPARPPSPTPGPSRALAGAAAISSAPPPSPTPETSQALLVNLPTPGESPVGTAPPSPGTNEPVSTTPNVVAAEGSGRGGVHRLSEEVRRLAIDEEARKRSKAVKERAERLAKLARETEKHKERNAARVKRSNTTAGVSGRALEKGKNLPTAAKGPVVKFPPVKPKRKSTEPRHFKPGDA